MYLIKQIKVKSYLFIYLEIYIIYFESDYM